MVDLVRYLPREAFIRMDPEPHDAVLRTLLIRAWGGVPNAEEREKLESLVHSQQMKDQQMGDGFAITHARLDDLADIRVSVGLMGDLRHFCRGPKVHTVFAALIPVDKAGEYLSFMARLGRLLGSSGAGETFRSADPDRILSFIREFGE